MCRHRQEAMGSDLALANEKSLFFDVLSFLISAIVRLRQESLTRVFQRAEETLMTFGPFRKVLKAEMVAFVFVSDIRHQKGRIVFMTAF